MASDDLQLVVDCKTPLVGLPTVNNLLFFPLIVCLRQTSPISSRSRLDSISCRPGLGHIATLQQKKSTSPRAPLGPNFFYGERACTPYFCIQTSQIFGVEKEITHDANKKCRKNTSLYAYGSGKYGIQTTPKWPEICRTETALVRRKIAYGS